MEQPTTTTTIEEVKALVAKSSEAIIGTIETKSKESIDKANSIVVADRSGYLAATDILSTLSKMSTRAKTLRKDAKSPFLDAGKFVDATFARVTEPIDKAINAIKDKMKSFNRKEEERIAAENRKRDEERRRLEDEQRKQREDEERIARENAEKTRAALVADGVPDEEAAEIASVEATVEPADAVPMPPEVLPVREMQKSTSTLSGARSTTRKRWTFEIVESKAVPREYLVPDEKKIKAAVATGVREIAGVRIFEEMDIVTG